mgnify:FL=1|jgi:hypothetical protein
MQIKFLKNMILNTKVNEKPIKAKRKRVINAKECEFELKEILIPLFEAYHQGIDMFNNEIQQTPPDARIRGFEANLLNAKLVQCIQKSFKEDWKRGRYGRIMLYKNGYIIFFKKLNNRDMPMNIRTKMACSIENQEQGILFHDDDNGRAPILFFGYKRNRFGEIVDPKIVYIDEGKVKWAITETDIDHLRKNITMVPEFPTAHVRVKSAVKDKTGTNDD